jgi:hypothetical protein
MNKIVKNFNGFKKIYENESQEEIKVETKPEDVKKIEDTIDQSIEQSLQNSPIENKIDQAIQAQSQRESGIKESVEVETKVESFTDDTFKLLADQIVKNAPSHRQYGKLKSIAYEENDDRSSITLQYEKGSLIKTSTGDDREHIQSILSDAAQRQKTLKWLAAASNIGGAALIGLGIAIIIYGSWKKGELYDQFTRELNQKYGFKTTSWGTIVNPEDYKYVDVDGIPTDVDTPIEVKFDELYHKDFIYARGGASWTDNGYMKGGYTTANYYWDWNKVMTSDQVQTLSEFSKQNLLNAALSTGAGALSIFAGFMLNKSAEKNQGYLSGITCLIKAVLEPFGIDIKSMTTEGDLVKALSKDYSHLSVG